LGVRGGLAWCLVGTDRGGWGGGNMLSLMLVVQIAEIVGVFVVFPPIISQTPGAVIISHSAAPARPSTPTNRTPHPVREGKTTTLSSLPGFG
jgi:hypothetical protein